MYALPPNNLIYHLVMDDGPAADARRRRVHDLDMQLQQRDWRNTDPGRGPVRGWGGGFAARRR